MTLLEKLNNISNEDYKGRFGLIFFPNLDEDGQPSEDIVSRMLSVSASTGITFRRHQAA
jgi:hypothetical protein